MYNTHPNTFPYQYYQIKPQREPQGSSEAGKKINEKEGKKATGEKQQLLERKYKKTT